MLKLLKNIFISMGLLIVFVVGVFFYVLFYIPNSEYYRGRFLLTATVEVDGKLKSGSSVYEVSYNRRQGSSGFGASPIKGARGTMPMIDLGKHGILMFSFRHSGGHIPGSLIAARPPKCSSTTPARLPTQIMGGVKEGYKFRDYLDQMISSKGKFNIGNKSIALSISINGEIQRTLQFCNLGIYTNNKIKPVDITIEHTNLPMDLESPYKNQISKSFWRSKFYND